jgi:16S rRNA (guanine527-N7)-methyltransferase
MFANSHIAEILAPYGLAPDAALCGRIQKYTELLLLWNQKISLTAVTNPEEILRFHLGESLFAAKGVPVEKGRLADVGSGAGFPGIPLAMVSRDIHATLIDSNQKKTAFLSEVIRELRLGNAEVVRKRFEDLEVGDAVFDFVTARALGQHPQLVKWAARSLAKSGKLILWIVKDDAAIISRVPGWDWRSPIAIPHSRNRVLLVGSSVL